jgi:hypothetical protein
MNASLKRKAIAAAVILIAAAVIVWLIAPVRNRTGDLRNDVHAINLKGVAPGAVSISASSQKKTGIGTMPLELASHREEVRAYGMVLPANDLIAMKKDYVAAKASVDKSSALLEASRKEYERLKALNADNHNVSDKVLQSAEAKWRSDEADAQEAEVSLEAVRETITFQWGRVVSGWLFDRTPEFNQLTELKEVLIRITLPSDKFIETTPGSVSIQAPGSKLVSARFVSRTPSADPRTQGIGFLYAASSYGSGLIPGMNVQAFMPVGPKVKGVAIPFSSVIWFQGKAWAYVQTGPEHFTRREVPVLNPAGNGYFVPGAFSPGEDVVIKGAQILLSRELLPSKPSGGGEEEEED